VSGAQPQPRAQQEAESQPEAQPQAQPQPQPLPQAEPQPHRPPQAYPAPPVSPPPVGPPSAGMQWDGQSAAGPSGPAGPAGQGQGGWAAGQPAAGTTEGASANAGPGPGAGTGTGAMRRPRTGARTVPRTRKARLRVAKADPWSVMKVSFLLSIALGVCTIVAVAVLWMVMNAMGVFSAIGGTVSQATQSGEAGGFDLESFLSLPRVLLFTSVVAVIDVVLATALATLGAFIYNLSAGFVGGVEVTLAEDE